MSTGDGVSHNTNIVIEQGGNVLDAQSGAKVDVQSGATESVEGELDVNSGGVQDVKSGATLNIHGTQVIKSGGVFEIDTGGVFKMNNVDLTAALASTVPDGTPGTASSGDTVVPDSNVDVTGFRYLYATKFTAGYGGGTAGSFVINSTTSSKGSTSYTMSDNSGNTATNVNMASQAGARTYTTPDAGASASYVMSEGNQTVNGIKTFSGVMPTITVTNPSFGASARPKADIATFSPAAGASGVCNMTLTVKDGSGTALARSTVVDIYLSDSATGDSIAAHVPDTSLTVVTNGIQLASLVTNKMLRCKTKNDGTLTLAIADGTKTGYYVAAVINGDVSVSAQLVSGNYGA